MVIVDPKIINKTKGYIIKRFKSLKDLDLNKEIERNIANTCCNIVYKYLFSMKVLKQESGLEPVESKINSIWKNIKIKEFKSDFKNYLKIFESEKIDVEDNIQDQYKNIVKEIDFRRYAFKFHGNRYDDIFAERKRTGKIDNTRYFEWLYLDQFKYRIESPSNIENPFTRQWHRKRARKNVNEMPDFYKIILSPYYF